MVPEPLSPIYGYGIRAPHSSLQRTLLMQSFLLFVFLQRPQKKAKEGEKEKKDKPDKGYCFWDSVTMTMRQISPAKKLEKMEGWEPPHIPVDLPSWGGRGFEEDSSRYANLTDSNESAAAVRWTSRAKVKLAGISRISRGIVSEKAEAPPCGRLQ
uniref:Uncharacterized protein n=1 Tax=Nothobranchius furzeri TaxID=105023 RepID=A0A8C6LE95_NOTFU